MDDFDVEALRSSEGVMAAARQVLLRVEELAEADRADGSFPLDPKRAGDLAEGTLVRWSDGGVGFIRRERDGEIYVYTPSTGYHVKPDDMVDFLLSPADVAIYLIYSRPMQEALWRSMLMLQASEEITSSVLAKRDLEEAKANARRQAIYRSATSA